MDDFVNVVLTLYKENRWREILNLNQSSNSLEARKLLWVWPSEINLNFIKNLLFEFQLSGVTSIGCGCGLLEWILQQSSGLPVCGYEINEEWWKSKYCNPQFIPLNFVELPLSNKILPTNYALLFCYFNDGAAFREYVNHYNGNLIIIIGPVSGSERYTDPEPFQSDFGQTQWKVYEYQEVKNTMDYIVAYIRAE